MGRQVAQQQTVRSLRAYYTTDRLQHSFNYIWPAIARHIDYPASHKKSLVIPFVGHCMTSLTSVSMTNRIQGICAFLKAEDS